MQANFPLNPQTVCSKIPDSHIFWRLETFCHCNEVSIQHIYCSSNLSPLHRTCSFPGRFACVLDWCSVLDIFIFVSCEGLGNCIQYRWELQLLFYWVYWVSPPPLVAETNISAGSSLCSHCWNFTFFSEAHLRTPFERKAAAPSSKCREDSPNCPLPSKR